MDDTQSLQGNDQSGDGSVAGDPVAAIADLDPAAAPEAAERYAADLETDLEQAGVDGRETAEMPADPGAGRDA
jgi:hypothetical protein